MSEAIRAETKLERLERLKRSLDHYEAQRGRHAGVQASRLRREVIKLSREIAEGRGAE